MSDDELVDGIGGAFLFSDDPGRLAAWYTAHLGVRFETVDGQGGCYRTYVAADPDDPSRRVDTTFSILPARFPTRRPVPAVEPRDMYGDQPFMLNLRVRDLDAVVEGLGAGGVEVLDRLDEDYGRFAWVRDADGHRLELYEPRAGLAAG